MDDPWITADVNKMLAKAKHPALTIDALQLAFDLMRQSQIEPTELQIVILTNHLSEMVDRSISGERLASVDPEMFSSISPVALMIASQIVTHIGHLADSEKYVLSIHFETAKNN
ncbi:PRD domain-containing protein [Lactiplantibacillus mudanjiangensis]|uniref:Transcriptional regulator [Lactobacillus pentosus] n=1 Tax=Lactiplantibacillus mudanjiangensis TaxID=1296538 RepID=A0A660DZE8_9LACO|nr:PRD domain-containing protein [Lactiplantibacillus mudanjiangensis]VDG22563.1 transcriptional regulator [Lactobacillus pentosus] [Lactiplantibacillus mudanjiangensis]VDG26901.1 transcriptional regulator [Lactobacillus pentosus] [Lactiplantibacillus mudanjiangensis]